MAGITPLLTAALPLVDNVVGAVGRNTATASTAAQQAAELEYRRQQDAARLAAEQQALERKYQEERAAEERRIVHEQQTRQEQTRLQQEAQLREWQRQDEVRRQEREYQRQQDELTRAREMDWLTRGHNQQGTQLRATQEEALRTRETEAQNRLAQLSATAAAEEKRRVDALRRTMARTRAAMGANGVSAADGSGEAILLGLVNETDAERKDAATADQIRRQAIQQEVDTLRRRNLLEQAQLAERQRLEFMSKFF